jgi:hypothetical protein
MALLSGTTSLLPEEKKKNASLTRQTLPYAIPASVELSGWPG